MVHNGKVRKAKSTVKKKTIEVCSPKTYRALASIAALPERGYLGGSDQEVLQA